MLLDSMFYSDETWAQNYSVAWVHLSGQNYRTWATENHPQK